MYLPFDASQTMEFPAFTYLIGIFGMFMYQTLDAVDGKQARRTGSSSPLGQLFDHGCDAINNGLYCFFYFQCMQFGTSNNFFIMSILSLVSLLSS
jgi:phosphatidylglycerophosphate synthase